MQLNQVFIMQPNQVPNPTSAQYGSWFLMQPNQVPNPTPTQYKSWLGLRWNWAKTELCEFYTQSFFCCPNKELFKNWC